MEVVGVEVLEVVGGVTGKAAPGALLGTFVLVLDIPSIVSTEQRTDKSPVTMAEGD